MYFVDAVIWRSFNKLCQNSNFFEVESAYIKEVLVMEIRFNAGYECLMHTPEDVLKKLFIKRLKVYYRDHPE